MEKMIAFCGLDCKSCKAFIATEEDDDTKRKAVAEEWSKAFGHELSLEEINCNGCQNREGRHIDYCSICEIRKCGIAKGVENCALCIDYSCEKLRKFHEQAPDAKRNLEEIQKACS